MLARQGRRSRHDQPLAQGQDEDQPARADSELEPGSARNRAVISSGDHAAVRPSSHDRCAECGDAVADSWVSYRQDLSDPQKFIEHFGGIVSAGPVEPKPDRPKRPIRDFRYPEDLGVFFHTSCAPRLELPKKLQEEIADILAKVLVADYEKTIARWAGIEKRALAEGEPPRFRAYVTSTRGRRVFTMTRADWQQFRSYSGKLIEIDLGRPAKLN